MVEKKKNYPSIVLDFFRFDSSRGRVILQHMVTILMGFSVSIKKITSCQRRRRCPVIDDALLIILAVDWPPANPIFINLNVDALKIQFQRKSHRCTVAPPCRFFGTMPPSPKIYRIMKLYIVFC